MSTDKRPSMATEDVHELDDLWDAFKDERAAHEYVRDMRWPAGVRCAHCEHDKVYETKRMIGKDDERRPSPRLQWKCADCGRKFSVTTNTPMERSHVPLRRWLYAIRHFPSAKNTQAALEIKRMCKVCYETAWFMMQRIREMMRLLLPGMIGGDGHIVEVDEAYQGGKRKGKRGRGAAGKKIVLAMVDRNTRQVRSIIIPDTKRQTLQDALKAHVLPGSMIVSDGLRAYEGLKDLFGGHERVDHGAKDGKRFRDGEASTNNNESFFSLIKNAILGTLKHVSTKHASRYVDEFVFRWNTSRMTDGDRFQHMIWGFEGRRLFLNKPKGVSFERHPLRDNYLVRRPERAP